MSLLPPYGNSSQVGNVPSLAQLHSIHGDDSKPKPQSPTETLGGRREQKLREEVAF